MQFPVDSTALPGAGRTLPPHVVFPRAGDGSTGAPSLVGPAIAEPTCLAATTCSLICVLADHYEQLIAHVRRHVGPLLGDSSTARDVVHDVYLELIENPPAGSIRVPLAFLREVVTRRAIDRHRVEKGRRFWVDNYYELPDSIDESTTGRNPECTACVRQRLNALIEAIDALPPRCRDVFVMHKIHELPQRDVANQLGISIKTVEKHLRLGVAACSLALREAA